VYIIYIEVELGVITGFLSSFIFICKYVYINRLLYLQNSMKLSIDHVKKCQYLCKFYQWIFNFLTQSRIIHVIVEVSGQDQMIRISNKSPMLLEKTSVLLSMFSSVLTEVTETKFLLASKKLVQFFDKKLMVLLAFLRFSFLCNPSERAANNNVQSTLITFKIFRKCPL